MPGIDTSPAERGIPKVYKVYTMIYQQVTAIFILYRIPNVEFRNCP
jgi:hypothetical protein